MAEYIKLDEVTVTDLSTPNVTRMYERGYIFGRPHKGYMYQTKSVRVDLRHFTLSSENRRILRKTEDITLKLVTLPFPGYTWQIHKMGKDFYSERFGDKVFSANKLKSLFTEPEKNNMTHALVYRQTGAEEPIGYCLCYKNETILHYAYPFYKLEYVKASVGISMMTKAIVWAKEMGLQYAYLGTYDGDKARYKLQFAGVEVV